MDVNLSDLIGVLAKNSLANPEEEFAHEQLKEIFADLALLPVPVRPLQRLWNTGELSVEIALAYFALWVGQWFADAETAKRRLMETNLRLALKTFRRLAYLRGAMTKLGQAAGNMPNILPSQIVQTLDRLHFAAPPMHYSLIREMVSNELGHDPEDLFQSFEKEAFAAASLGQVHRARLTSGEEVAVKIQYPGIARTIDADFRNLGVLLFPARLTQGWEATKAQFDAIHRMLTQEVDYEQEAESLRQARRLFPPDDGIVVPRVYADYSSRRVLTMEFVPGLNLQDFLATDPSQELRDRFGTKMYTACARMYEAHMNYADPHSGNYVFMEDGRLGLLDFGCVQHYNTEEQELTRLGNRLLESMDTLPEFMKCAGVSSRDLANPEYVEMCAEVTRWMIEPVLQEGPFDFGNEAHLKSGVERFSRLIQKRYTRSHPMYVYLYRSVFGLRAVLYRLRARVDVGEVFRAALKTD